MQRDLGNGKAGAGIRSMRGFCGNAVSNVPQFFVKKMLHALVQYLHRCAHRTHHAAANDALREFEMVETEQVHPLIEIQHALGDIVHPEELRVTAVKIIYRQVFLLQFLIKGLPQPRDQCAGEQRTGSQDRCRGPVRPGSGGSHGCNRLQNMQHRDGILQLHVGTPDEARGIQIVAFRHALQSTLQLKGCTLHQEFGSLMNDLKCHLVLMQKLRGRLLQCEQLVRAQVAFVVGCSLAGKDWFAQLFGFVMQFVKSSGASSGPAEIVTLARDWRRFLRQLDGQRAVRALDF